MKSVDLAAGIMLGSLERGWVPDGLTRAAIRMLCRRRLHQLEQGSETDNARAFDEFVEATRGGPIAPIPELANEQHYELPAEFFTHVLGPRRKYSCCYYDDEQTTLEEAEEAALRRTCERAGIEDGMQILDLGCGWGSLSLWLLQQYPHCRVTAVSNSVAQRQAVWSEAARQGLHHRLDVITADMNRFEPSGRFDRVVSIEMFEHMRNYERLLERIAAWLKEDGRLFVHIFCHRKFAYAFETGGAANWMGRHFFSGGIMPSEFLLPRFNRDLQVTQHWRWSGKHYARTSEDWLRRLDAGREQILPMLARTYGAAASRWYWRWRLFFLAVAEFFALDEGREWFVAHYLLEPTRASHRPPDASQVLVPGT